MFFMIVLRLMTKMGEILSHFYAPVADVIKLFTPVIYEFFVIT
jgi:hypothetical protein